MIWFYRFALLMMYWPYRIFSMPKRLRMGKEDPVRYREKFGFTDQNRPQEKPLLWMHAASVGESVSLLPLIYHYESEYQILITTGTITSAKVMEKRLPKTVLHQFAPLDFPACINRFLDHWQPDYVIWVESELWLNTIHSIQSRGIPLALVNMRLSQKSRQTWAQFKGLFQGLLSCFDAILTQTKDLQKHLQTHGISNIIYVGNLKYVRNTPIISQDDHDTARSVFKSNFLWMAASTHAGEEAVALKTHKAIGPADGQATLILAPRHPERVSDVIEFCKSMELSFETYEHWIPSKTPITTDVFIIDTIGVLPLFYDISDVVFVGGSLIDGIGGHSILEPLFHSTPVVHGPYMENFEEAVQDTQTFGASRVVMNQAMLQNCLETLISNSDDLTSFTNNAAKFSESTSSILPDIIAYLDQNFFTKAPRI